MALKMLFQSVYATLSTCILFWDHGPAMHLPSAHAQTCTLGTLLGHWGLAKFKWSSTVVSDYTNHITMSGGFC